VYTRCPGCHTVHPVNAALLARGAGRYRCGKCNKVSNALESLFDAWPEASAQGTKAGDIPVLGASLDLEGAARARREHPEAPEDAEVSAADTSRSSAATWLLRAAWMTGALLVLVLALDQWGRFQGKPLFEQTSIQSSLVRLGLRAPPPRPPARDPDLIHLVSRELTSHPTRPGYLRLNATLVNRAPRSQPYPDIDVDLLDAAGKVVHRERFAPSDYLAPGTPAGAGLAPQAYLPLALDLEDPGEQAVGFELEFR
jgi:predicted Zn finger-like uncharacterized protein